MQRLVAIMTSAAAERALIVIVRLWRSSLRNWVSRRRTRRIDTFIDKRSWNVFICMLWENQTRRKWAKNDEDLRYDYPGLRGSSTSTLDAVVRYENANLFRNLGIVENPLSNRRLDSHQGVPTSGCQDQHDDGSSDDKIALAEAPYPYGVKALRLGYWWKKS